MIVILNHVCIPTPFFRINHVFLGRGGINDYLNKINSDALRDKNKGFLVFSWGIK